jgi:two-component system nitrogen regulation sensor histidine kinase NtrY
MFLNPTLLVWMLACVALLGLVALLGAAAALIYTKKARAREPDQAGPSEREALLLSLLDASPVAMVLCTEAGLIVFENEAARALFFEGKSAQGLNFLRLAEGGPAALHTALLSPRDEMVGLTIDGQQETYHFARRTFTFEGKPHTLLVVRPVTREIARHDLETMRDVVRVLSHEVNNSLAPVSSLVHTARTIVQTGTRLERLHQVFDTIEERSRHLSNFIGGYANLARLPAPAPSVLAWSPLITRLSALYPAAKLSVPEGAQGFFDPAQLEQALINLLKNAQEAGGPPEEVRLELTPLPEGGTELRVLDRGAGFSQEALEGALLPFFTTKAGGSGIGLALVREIVHAHHGRISLAAREGGGASITLLLPGPSTDAHADTHARLTLTRA